MVKDGEMSTTFFLNLEKYCAAQGSLHTIIVNGKDVNEPQAISNAFYDFHLILFKNLYKGFLIMCLSINLMIIKPLNVKVL